jgi:hypothetical protein
LQAVLLLVGVAEDGDENDSRFQITTDVNVVDGDKADVVDVELAADGLANRAPQQLAHPVMSEIGHKSKWIGGFLDGWIMAGRCAFWATQSNDPSIHKSAFHSLAATFSTA